MFDIIYADPPWQYNNSDNLAKVSILDGKINQHYPTMPTADIMKLDVKSISAKDSLLFLWVVSPMLTDGINVLLAWGFEYSTIGFVWDKQRANPGSYTMSQVEICLIGKRGKIPTPRGARNIRQFLSEKKTKHSAKPEEVRNRITQMFPNQQKVELFARERVDGWHAIGNEIDGKGIEIVL